MLNRRTFLQSSLVASSECALGLTPMRGLSASKANFPNVRSRIQSAIDDGRATSLALAVVHHGNIVWEEAFGFRDREECKLATVHTPYCLASITKTFTATLITALSERHRFSLDDPAAPFLRTTSLQGPHGDPSTVTIRMLGAHCSGLPEMFTAHLMHGPAAVMPTASFLQEYGRLAYSPGTIYEYSNIGYEVLGAIVEQLTSQAFGRVLKQQVLVPLGMADCFFSDAAERLSSAASGYDVHAVRIPPYRTSTPPSGELYASAHDLARYLLLQLSKFGWAPALDLPHLNNLRRPVFTGPKGVSSTFGWFTTNLSSGEPYYFKTGGQPGVAAKLLFFPSLDLGCAVLTNQTGAMSLVNECCEGIIRNYASTFHMPQEDAGPEGTAFQPTDDLVGSWQGTLINGGANQRVRFNLDQSGSATLALSDEAPHAVLNMQSQGVALVGSTRGLVECAQAEAFGVRTLALKLVPRDGALTGRVIAEGTRPGLLLANIPYVLSLRRL